MCNVVRGSLSCTSDDFPGVLTDWPDGPNKTVYNKQWNNVSGIKAALDEINLYLLACITNDATVLHTNNTEYTPYKNADHSTEAGQGTVNSYTNTSNNKTAITCNSTVSYSYTNATYGSTSNSYTNSSYNSTVNNPYNPDYNCRGNVTSGYSGNWTSNNTTFGGTTYSANYTTNKSAPHNSSV